MSALQYLNGFSWPVPIAFASAVSACRFEQGDMLYDAKIGYRDWATALDGLSLAIQVHDPPKSNRAMAADQEGSRFLANWNSDVTLSITAFSTDTVSKKTTSQGRLFTFLWRGDPADLDSDGLPPEPPRMQRELHRALEQAVPAFRRSFAKAKREAASVPAKGAVYLSAVDLSSDAGRAKASDVQGALAERFEVCAQDIVPLRAGIDSAERYHPALVLRGLLAVGAAPEEVEAILKQRLYSPGAEREGRADRFSLARHGHLAPLAADD
jgi:hypothetical protein